MSNLQFQYLQEYNYKILSNFQNFKGGHSSEFIMALCRFFTALIYRERCKIISFSVSEKMLN
jgi:hypothetical protein